ncbi:MAG: VWA domain-containing protein [Gemmataceae bacterium]|nr:VWA domain-containing protein [Gemmataceae bacterium]MDW8264253.1 VWA domain-containing protein [Gemmataceae bacterium]
MNALRTWFAHPWLLSVLWLPVLGELAAWWAGRRAERRLGRLGPWRVMALLRRPDGWGTVRVWCRWGAATAVLLGLAGPRWGQEAQPATAPGRDLVIFLDLSRSMLADDVPPHRLGRAKAALAHLVDTIERRGGHRLGLVVGAAQAKVVCPLTHDYDHFREQLADLDAAAPPPGLRPRGGSRSGTRLGAGLQEAVAAHDPRFRGHQEVLMISDGDDPAGDGEWEFGIMDALSHGIPVSTVGIGDPVHGGRIPLGGDFVRYDSQPVVSRLDERPLQEIARRTGGVYLPARTEWPDLETWFVETVEPKAAAELGDDALPQLRSRAGWFFGTAWLLLALAMVAGRYRS